MLTLLKPTANRTTSANSSSAASTKATSWTIPATATVCFTTRTAASTQGSGLKTRCKAVGLYTTPTTELHTKGSGRTTSFMGMACCTTSCRPTWRRRLTSGRCIWWITAGWSMRVILLRMRGVARGRGSWRMGRSIAAVSARICRMEGAFMSVSMERLSVGTGFWGWCSDICQNKAFIIVFLGQLILTLIIYCLHLCLQTIWFDLNLLPKLQ